MIRRGIVSFVFDDGYQHVLENVVPLLDSFKLPGVFAVPLNEQAINKSEPYPAAPWQAWRAALGQRHELAAHSVNHINLTTLADDEIQAELALPHETLGASTVVYPGGAFDDRVVSAAARYYSAGRTVQRGYEHIHPPEPLRLRSFNYTQRNFTVARANARVLWAWLTNRWLIETFHIVHDDAGPILHAVSLKDLTAHLRFVARFPVHVSTIANVMTTQIT